MPLAPTKGIRILKGPGQIKVNSNLSQLPEASHTQEVSQEAMITPEVVAVTKMVQEIMKEEDLGTEMTDLSHKAGLILRLKVASDAAKQTMSHRTVTSRKKPV